MGIYKRPGSRLYWMSYTVKGEQYRESTKTSIHAAATKIWKQREAEVALQLFQVGWPGERITFDRLCQEYYDSHVKNLSDNSKAGFENSKRQLVKFFSGRMVTDISTDGIREYRDFRRQQPLKNRPDRTVKGATVNRELETLQGLFKLAVQRSYIQTDPTLNVEHFPEVRERPAKKRITTQEYLRILEKAPAYLRVGILLLEQTGNRTYSELFTLRWEQVDLDAGVISFNTPLKTADSDTAHPLSDLAVKALRWWREQTLQGNPFIFPSPRLSGQPIRNVRKTWAKTLEDAEVGYFPIYQLRHAFCTRVSKVASDAVVTKAMRHSSAETKRRYQLGMVEEVREAMNLANTEAFGQLENHIFSTVTSPIATNRKEDAAELVET